jgi:type I restriction enzyme R subunit
VTTVQSLLFNNKYQQLFSPTDFDLVISDEAHRSIGGNARAVFDFFIGYKLGLTATPRDYLKKYVKSTSATKDPREFERRVLLDTYRTFGCEDGQPTFRYSLLDGVWKKWCQSLNCELSSLISSLKPLSVRIFFLISVTLWLTAE